VGENLYKGFCKQFSPPLGKFDGCGALTGPAWVTVSPCALPWTAPSCSATFERLMLFLTVLSTGAVSAVCSMLDGGVEFWGAQGALLSAEASMKRVRLMAGGGLLCLF
jgi:hypothetical protein